MDIGYERSRADLASLPSSSHEADFVAIDFETANRHRWSACAVGVTIVRGGIIADRGATLINPDGEFSEYNSAITGIRQEDVEEAPYFSDVWPQLSELLAGRIVVAHSATFDLGVLRQAAARAELTGIDMKAICSWRLARRTWPHLPSYGLSYLSTQLGLDLDHHEAGSDATACAEVVLSAIHEVGATDIEGMCAQIGLSFQQLNANSFIGAAAFGDVKNTRGAEDADPGHPLYDRHICFTGAMFSMTRNEAAERIVQYGAHFKSTVTRVVDLVVIGDADFVAFADGWQTGKLKKAIELREFGQEIEIVAERDFLALLHD